MSFLITVYITNYNYGNYLEKAIQSVYEQSYDKIELIIIDDGSTDNSKEIIEKYRANTDIKIIYQKNKGLNATNNVALHHAQGKYIMRLDADDYLHPEALEKMSEKLELNKQLGLVFPNYYLVDKDNNIISEEVRHDFDNEVILYDQAAHGACTMIRADYLRSLGGYNESYKCQDGYELWVKFTRKYLVSNINEPLFYYRQHGSNLTSNENKILDTRAQINSDFIAQGNYDTSSLIIIPVRGVENDITFKSLGENSFLTHKINQALKAKCSKAVVVTSPNIKVKDIIEKRFPDHPNIFFHQRKEGNAKYGSDLNNTILDIIQSSFIDSTLFSNVGVLTVEYPFLKPFKIDDALHTMLLFGSDSLISVRASTSTFYVHRGDGLHSVMNRDKFTKLEREAIYTHVGGITFSTKISFLQNKKVISGLIGHQIIDQESAFGVFSNYDYELACKLYQN